MSAEDGVIEIRPTEVDEIYQFATEVYELVINKHPNLDWRKKTIALVGVMAPLYLKANGVKPYYLVLDTLVKTVLWKMREQGSVL